MPLVEVKANVFVRVIERAKCFHSCRKFVGSAKNIAILFRMSEIPPAQAENTTPSVSNDTQNIAIAGLDERAYATLVQQIKETDAPAPAPTPEVKPEEPKPEESAEVATEPAVEAPVEAPQPEVEEKADALPERIRVGGWNEEERKALQIRARNPDLTLAQAMEMVKKNESEPGKQKLESPASYLDKIEEAIKSKAEAFKALEFDKAAEIEIQVAKLQREMRDAERQAQKEEIAQEESRQVAVEEAKSKSVKYYPDSANQNSALVTKMNEIFTAMKETQNPLLSDAQLPWKLTQMAANELGIAPKANGTATKALASSPVKQRSALTPASGNARTSTPTPLNARDLANQIEDLDQLQVLVGRL